MEIKVLGPGCPKCGEVEERVKGVLAELGIAADVEKVADIERMISYGILATPGLVIDGRLVSSGRIPRLEEIKAWIQRASA
jgi:small redox-active disulfide protein 2